MWRERSLRQPISLSFSPNTRNTEVARISRQGLFAYLRTSVSQLMSSVIDTRAAATRPAYAVEQPDDSTEPLQNAVSEDAKAPGSNTGPQKIMSYEEYRERLIADLDEQHSKQWSVTGKTPDDTNDGIFDPEE